MIYFQNKFSLPPRNEIIGNVNSLSFSYHIFALPQADGLSKSSTVLCLTYRASLFIPKSTQVVFCALAFSLGNDRRPQTGNCCSTTKTTAEVRIAQPWLNLSSAADNDFWLSLQLPQPNKISC